MPLPHIIVFHFNQSQYMTVGKIATTIFYILDVTLPWPSPIEAVQHQNIAVCLCSTFVTLNHNFIEIHTKLCFAKYQWQQYIAYSLSSWILIYVSHDINLQTSDFCNGSGIYQTPLATPRSATSPAVLLSQPATPSVVLPLQSAIPTNPGVVLLPSPVVMEAPVTSDVVALAPNATLPVFSSVVAVVPNTLSLGIAGRRGNLYVDLSYSVI